MATYDEHTGPSLTKGLRGKKETNDYAFEMDLHSNTKFCIYYCSAVIFVSNSRLHLYSKYKRVSNIQNEFASGCKLRRNTTTQKMNVAPPLPMNPAPAHAAAQAPAAAPAAPRTNKDYTYASAGAKADRAKELSTESTVAERNRDIHCWGSSADPSDHATFSRLVAPEDILGEPIGLDPPGLDWPARITFAVRGIHWTANRIHDAFPSAIVKALGVDKDTSPGASPNDVIYRTTAEVIKIHPKIPVMERIDAALQGAARIAAVAEAEERHRRAQRTLVTVRIDAPPSTRPSSRASSAACSTASPSSSKEA
jgi:hypothetical protein